jgi:membrane fusion protein (multidrug efflux system)
MKVLRTAMVVIGITGALVLAWWLQNRPVRAPEPRSAQAAVPSPGRVTPGGPGAGPQGAGGPVAVEVGRVESMRIEDDTQAVGTLRSRQGVMLRPEVSGRVARLAFADGQRVRKGNLLVQLDDTLQLAQLKQAEAQASIARTNLQRNRELVAQGFISQSAVDQSVANLQVAEAQVALAHAQLARMRIVAPFDGMVGIRNVNVGDYVKDGADLVAVEDTSAMWVDFRLPERFLDRVRKGQQVQVRLDALPGRTLQARVDATDSLVDANGRSLQVRAQLPNADGVLKSGLFARTRIVFAVREKALVVPEEALVPLGAQQFVFKIVDAPGGGRVSERMLARVGLRLPGKAEILEGLSEGDKVVTAGHGRLMRSEPVPVREIELGRPADGRAATSQAGQGPRTAP